MILFLSLSIVGTAIILSASNSYFLSPLRKLQGVTDEMKLTYLNQNEYRNLFLSFGLLSSILITYGAFDTVCNHPIYKRETIDVNTMEQQSYTLPIIEEKTPIEPKQTTASASTYNKPKESKTEIKQPLLVDTITTTGTPSDISLTSTDDIEDEKLTNPTFTPDTHIYRPSDTKILSNAHYKGGLKESQRFIRENLIFPQDILDQTTEGKIYLTFIVNTDGSIEYAQILKGTSYTSFNKEALRVINKMPNWEPALKKDSSVVRQQLVMPIDFRVE